MRSAQIIGNIANEIQNFQTGDGNDIAVFQVAADDDFGNTSFIPCRAYQRQAEMILEYFGKGDRIIVTGNVTRDSWQDEDTNEWRERFYVNVRNFEFPSSGTSGQSEAEDVLDGLEPEQEDVDEEDLPTI